MEDKYYTPDLEEFCPFFEFEKKRDVNYDLNIVEEIWDKEVASWVDLDMVFDDYEHNFEDIKHIYRVKYLSKSDIEECGFKFIGGNIINELNQQLFEKYNCRNGIKTNRVRLTLNYLGNQSMCNIEEFQDCLMNYRVNDEQTWMCVNSFTILIKNKSELKRILKMLNIE